MQKAYNANMVFQNSIPFGAPSQRRLHMVAGPQDEAYVAVLNQFNEQQGNLHHMVIPIAELEALAKAGEGSVTARGPKASITFKTGDHSAHYDFSVICEDAGEDVHTETEVERSEFEELIATLRPQTAGV
jgi:hypothetical protein